MMTEKQITIQASPLPQPTWNWIHINNTPVNVLQKIDNAGEIQISEGTHLYTGEELENEDIKALYDKCKTNAVGAMGEEYDRWLDSNCGNYLMVLEENTSKQAKIFCEIGTVARVCIYAKKGSCADVSLIIKSKVNNCKNAFLTITCYLEDSSKIQIKQIQMLGSDESMVFDIGSFNERNASLEVVRVDLGGSNSYLGLKAELDGENSSLESELAYLGRGKSRIDINDIALHRGLNTRAQIHAEGVLMEEAYKNYKATIDFRNGCAGSTGSETENVLLFGDEIVNKSTPLILCREEDVEGNHGSSIGRIEESLLFYMQTRGIDINKAKELIVAGRLESVLSDIEDTELEQQGREYIREAVMI